MFGRATIRLGIGPHSSYSFFTGRMLFLMLDQQCQSTEGNQKHLQGGHKVGEKNSTQLSRLVQSHNYTFPEVITTKSVRNNDLHISRVIPHQLLLMWLTRACRTILAQINSFRAPDTLGCIWIAWHSLHPDCTVYTSIHAYTSRPMSRYFNYRIKPSL